MVFVLISVLFSVSVSVLLKFARQRGIDTWQMIVWNYPAAVLLTYLIFQPDLSSVSVRDLPWSLYIPAAVLLPSLFMMLSQSLRYAGLVLTEVAQRMSLLLSLLAAAFLFAEVFTPVRLAGIGLGFLAIACMIGWQRETGVHADRKMVFFPLLVFAGYGSMDILFKMLALQNAVAYTTSIFILFSGAMLLAGIYLLYQRIRQGVVLSAKAMFCGLVLGMLNFGNILCYMKAHRALADSPSTVFAAMNIGVIGLGTLIGVWFFQERLSTFNKIGLVLAIISVLMIAYL